MKLLLTTKPVESQYPPPVVKVFAGQTTSPPPLDVPGIVD